MITKYGRPAASPSGIIPHFSNCVEAHGLIYVSGQLPFDADMKLVEGSISDQTHQCLTNMERILESAGLNRSHVIKTTIWLTDTKDFAGFNESYREFFTDTPPARSTVCSHLMVPGAKIEIEAIAARP